MTVLFGPRCSILCIFDESQPSQHACDVTGGFCDCGLVEIPASRVYRFVDCDFYELFTSETRVYSNRFVFFGEWIAGTATIGELGELYSVSFIPNRDR